MGFSKVIQIGLVGGDAGEALAAICVDLDRGNCVEDWAALVREDRVDELLTQTGAAEVSRRDWEGDRFGDGNGGTVELVGGRVVGNGLYVPALSRG